MLGSNSKSQDLASIATVSSVNKKPWQLGNTVVPPQYCPSVDRLPSNAAADFQVPNIFSRLYMTPLTAIFQYPNYIASPKSGGIGGDDCTWL